MIGLVLAAGAGRRLRPYTDAVPKTLVPVDGTTTILDVCLRNLAAVDLRRVVVVIGYARQAVEILRPELERRHGIEIELVVNPHAEDRNNAYSLWTARDHLRDGALLVNGDTVHPASVEETLLTHRDPHGAGVLLALDTDKTLADEEMKVGVDDDGNLARITKLMPPAEAAGEYIGVSLIEPGAAEPLADALQVTWERDHGLYYEDGYQEYADRGRLVRPVPLGPTTWVEVDDHADLERARDVACRC
ncbi:phosphocholine cytidylyltransferase family protein [Actinomycetospora sp.]|uniref:phosphocholine cytidylyltransferase family protein n=1 Tax=Actinomycetospora sp. TaxID=1872135 RepID=UPI002F412713